jgi:hypothetical protein
MRLLSGLMALFAILLWSGCDKDTDGAKSSGPEEGSAVASGGATQSKLPKTYWGTYQGEKRHKIVVMPTGIKSSGIICSKSVSFASVTCNDEGCDWVADGGKIKGNLSFMADKSLMISTTGTAAGCYDEGLSGQFTKGGKPAAVASGGAKLTAKAAAAPSDDAEAPAAKPDAAAPSGKGFSVGSRVSCNWKSGGIQYNGKITRKSGNSIHVSYDDGDQEDTVTSKCRLLGGGGAAAASANMVSATVFVTVNERKPNGKAWDAFGGQPDIALCVSGGGSTQCYPGGGSVIGVMDPKCRDSLRCTFSGVKVPKGTFSLTVVDVDLAVNDTVGQASCKKGSSCTAGSATIKVR